MDSSQRVSISAANIADFFNTVGRRAADRVQGQDTFPMGGYFNEFRRSAVTVTLVEQLRAAVEQCMTSAGLDVAAITKNANTGRYTGVLVARSVSEVARRPIGHRCFAGTAFARNLQL